MGAAGQGGMFFPSHVPPLIPEPLHALCDARDQHHTHVVCRFFKKQSQDVSQDLCLKAAGFLNNRFWRSRLLLLSWCC